MAVALASVMALGAGAEPSNDDSEVEADIQKAERLARWGRYGAAERTLDQVLEEDSVSEPLRRRAREVRAEVLLKEAAAILESSDQSEPQEKRRERRRRALEKAADDLRAMTSTGSGAHDAHARRSLIFTLFHLHQLDEALEELAQFPKGADGGGRAFSEIRDCLDRLAERAAAPVGSGAKGATRPYEESEVTPPVPVHAPTPPYTSVARRMGTTGEVLMQLLIDESGAVLCAKVLSGLPHGLNDRARSTAFEWRFEPATLNERPVAAWYHTTVHFGFW